MNILTIVPFISEYFLAGINEQGASILLSIVNINNFKLAGETELLS